LNAAATALLQSNHSEKDVFRLFSQQMARLGIDSTLYSYQPEQRNLKISAFTLPPETVSRLKKATALSGFQVEEQTFTLDQVPPLAEVILHQQPVFFAEAKFFLTSSAEGGLGPLANQLAANRAVIVAPFLHEQEVLGLLSVSGTYLTEADVPLFAAFANQIAVSLVNARLFAAAKRTEQKYRHLFDNAPIMYIVTENRGGEAYIAESNQLLLDLLGYTKEELIGRPLASIYSQASQQQLRQGGYEKALAGQLTMQERELITRDGRIIVTTLHAMPEWDTEGQVTGTRAIFLDITAHRKAEAELKAYQEHLQNSLDELNILIPASAIVTHASQNADVYQDIAEYLAAAFGSDGCALYARHESDDLFLPLINLHRLRSIGWAALEGNSTPILMTPAIHQTITQQKVHLLHDQQPGLMAEDQAILWRHQAKTALLVPMIYRDEAVGLAELYSYSNREYTQRELLFVQTLANYLTIGLENARLFEALRKNKDNLEEQVAWRTQELQQRNQELDGFAHTVAHDLQGLLAQVVMYTDTLYADYARLSSEDHKQYLRTISRSGRKMKEVIDSLFLLATVGQAEVKIAPLKMGEIIQDVLQRLDDEIKQTQAHLELPTQWPAAQGYRPWIEAIWVNYMSNALKYGGRPLCITLGATPLESGQVQFWIQDEGEGIPPEDQARLFEPFIRLHSQEKGHGLGLSIVKRIAERLGGMVGVSSQPGKGSRFYFTLPG
jgi:PAS domain S-box-containing protein